MRLVIAAALLVSGSVVSIEWSAIAAQSTCFVVLDDGLRLRGRDRDFGRGLYDRNGNGGGGRRQGHALRFLPHQFGKVRIHFVGMVEPFLDLLEAADCREVLGRGA